VRVAVEGNISSVSRKLNIPRQTLSDWSREDWFISLVGDVRHEKAEETASRYQELSLKALAKADAAIDRLSDDLNTSDIKALVIASAAATDKQRLLLNQATVIRADSAGIESLAKTFASLSEQWTEKQANVVQVIDQPGKNKDCD
jgi:hypothetical protein